MKLQSKEKLACTLPAVAGSTAVLGECVLVACLQLHDGRRHTTQQIHVWNLVALQSGHVKARAHQHVTPSSSMAVQGTQWTCCDQGVQRLAVWTPTQLEIYEAKGRCGVGIEDVEVASLELMRTIHSKKDLELKSIKSCVWSLEGRSLVISDGSAEIEYTVAPRDGCVRITMAPSTSADRQGKQVQCLCLGARRLVVALTAVPLKLFPHVPASSLLIPKGSSVPEPLPRHLRALCDVESDRAPINAVLAQLKSARKCKPVSSDVGATSDGAKVNAAASKSAGEAIDLRGTMRPASSREELKLGSCSLGMLVRQNHGSSNLAAVEALMDIDATKKRAAQYLRSQHKGDGASLLLLQMPVDSTSREQPSLQCYPVNGVPAPDLIATTSHHSAGMTLASRPLAWTVVGSTRNSALALYRADGAKLRHIARVQAKKDKRVTRGLACAVWRAPAKVASATEGFNKDVEPAKGRAEVVVFVLSGRERRKDEPGTFFRSATAPRQVHGLRLQAFAVTDLINCSHERSTSADTVAASAAQKEVVAQTPSHAGGLVLTDSLPSRTAVEQWLKRPLSTTATPKRVLKLAPASESFSAMPESAEANGSSGTTSSATTAASRADPRHHRRPHALIAESIAALKNQFSARCSLLEDEFRRQVSLDIREDGSQPAEWSTVLVQLVSAQRAIADAMIRVDETFLQRRQDVWKGLLQKLKE